MRARPLQTISWIPPLILTAQKFALIEKGSSTYFLFKRNSHQLSMFTLNFVPWPWHITFQLQQRWVGYKVLGEIRTLTDFHTNSPHLYGV